MEFGILGPLQVVDGDRSVPVPSRGKRATVLAALLVRCNQIVATERLIELLWGEQPPEGAANTLYSHVSHLRATLGTGGANEQVLVTRSGGYQLAIQSDALDSVRFERLVMAARPLLSSDPAAAASKLREALSLWRGRALEGFQEQAFARAESLRLEEARLAAFEDLIDAEMALGRHAAITGQLRSLVADHPTRERLTAQLMRALYHTGRQAEALDCFGLLRARMVDQLGIEPSRELRQLERAVLRQELDGTSSRAPEDRSSRSREQQGAVQPLPSSRLPLPSLLIRPGRIFVGRDADLARLQQLWNETTAGGLRSALIAGEPGVGKTRLAAELATHLNKEGATVLAGRCDEDLGVPFQPFVEALRDVVDHTPPEELRQRLGRYAGELARLLPELSKRVPDLPPALSSDPETERYRLFDAVASWLAATAAEQPLLLVLEDLQWAAKPTLLLLRHVLGSHEAQRLLVVITYRDDEVGRAHPLNDLFADLRRQIEVVRIPLSGLEPSDVADFLEQAAGHALGPQGDELARAIHRDTEGNAFFVREVVRHLIESGDLREQDERWMTSGPIEQLGIPDGVRDVVGRRLSRLSESANRALAVAAVIGLQFELAVLERGAGLDEEVLVSALDEALAARLVAEVPACASRYRFAHGLVRATLYDELTVARQVILHRRVAEAIESVHGGRLDDYLPALAHHFARASAPTADTAKAVRYATLAGDRALAQLAHDEAAHYYRQALDLLNLASEPVGEAHRLELLLSLGEAERRGGNPAHRQTLLDAARLAQALGDGHALAQAALGNSRGGAFSGAAVVDAERVAVLEAALSRTGDTDTATRARLLANLGAELYWSPNRDAGALSDEALNLARRLDDPATLAHVLRARFYATLLMGRAHPSDERWAAAAELLGVAQSIGDPAITWEARFIRAYSAMEMGDMDECDDCLELAGRLAGDLGQPSLQWITTWLGIGRVLLSGRIRDAELLALDALELGESSGQPDARTFFRGQRFQIRFEQGRLDEVEASLTRIMSRLPGLPIIEALLALLYAELDRDDQARPLFERFAASDFQRLPNDPSRLRGLTSLALVAAHLDDAPRAHLLHDLLTPYADNLDIFACLVAGPVSHYLGMLATTLGRFAEAEDRFAAAAATNARIGAPTWLARTQLEWARMVLTRSAVGHAERARDLLAQARATARELGLGNVERRAAALLSQVV